MPVLFSHSVGLNFFIKISLIESKYCEALFFIYVVYTVYVYDMRETRNIVVRLWRSARHCQARCTGRSEAEQQGRAIGASEAPPPPTGG